MTRARRRAAERGFTLLELIVALLLLALMAAVMVGSVSLSARSWDGGEAKAADVADMRQTQAFLREQLSAQYPQRVRGAVDLPLMFAGERDEIRYAAALPPRVAGGGVYFFRLALARSGAVNELVLERVIPEPGAAELPSLDDSERSVLASGIAELRIGYFGRDPNAQIADEPTWRDRWDDRQRLPDLVRVDVKPERGAAWPTLVVEPRRSPEAGCRAWDPARGLCVGLS
ncbi:MAG: prepilin-type N-terminal cleavage/methylation domain-containing protein [Betaproteobacteria bacterium]|nr:prepilin-type N-terminal cleavage/methylation domain-containing protein [Betaproteobacteria bacterium]MBL0292377.1 prepilin-type N-terminal cleavage/methylation domain-containing protein [Betaproteobacteria bacterium]